MSPSAGERGVGGPGRRRPVPPAPGRRPQHRPGRDDDGEGGGGPLDLGRDSEQGGRGVVDGPVGELDLEARPAPVGRLDDGVDLVAALGVAQMEDAAHAGGLCGDAQVVDRLGLQNDPEGLGVVQQAGGAGAQERERQGRVRQVPLGGLDERSARAKARRPGRLVLHQEQPRREVVQLGDHGVRGMAPGDLAHASAHRGQGGRLGHQTRVGREERPEPARVAAGPAHQRIIVLAHFVDIGHDRLGGVIGLQVEPAGPAPADHPGDVVGDRRLGAGRRFQGVVEKAAERGRCRRGPALGQAHGAHGQVPHSPGAGVPAGVLLRRGGAGEDELPPGAPVVDGVADGVPHARDRLPLVEEPGGRPVQQETGIGRGQRHDRRVLVQADLGGRHPARGLRLAAGAGALDDNGPARPQRPRQLAVHRAGKIGAHARHPMRGRE